MFWKPEFSLPVTDGDDMAEVRAELRDIAKALRALSAGVQPQRPVDILGDQIRAQMARIEERRAA